MSKVKILVIDDEPSVQKAFDNFFDNSKDKSLYEIDFAVNGALGIEKLRQNKQDFAIVDIRMPVMDGITMLKQLEQENLHPNIIILSAFLEPKYTREFESKENILDILSKVESDVIVLEKIRERVNRISNITLPVVVETKIEPFDYQNLNATEAVEIKETIKSIKEEHNNLEGFLYQAQQSAIRIGFGLKKLKEQVPHGQFIKLLNAEFGKQINPVRAARFMAIADKFGSMDIAIAGKILISSMYSLVSGSVSTETFDKVIELVATDKVTTNKEIIKILEEESKKSTKKKDKNKDYRSSSNSPSSENSKLITTAPPRIIGNLISKTENCWQLDRHLLYCGNPNSPRFKKLITNNISLAIVFPPRKDWSLDLISTHSEVVFYSDRQDLDSQAIRENVEQSIKTYTESDELVIFGYLGDPYLLQIAHNLDCQCFIAEPDRDKCQAIINFWQQQGNKVETRSIDLLRKYDEIVYSKDKRSS